MASFPRLDDGPSIYEVVRSHVTGAGELDDPHLDLPDDAAYGRDTTRWAPGAIDGVMSHHAVCASTSTAAHVPWVTHLLCTAADEPTETHLRALHGELNRVSPLVYVEDLLTAVGVSPCDRERLRAVARWLATTSANRRAVKIGVALLGLLGFTDDDADVVWALALHEEFTLFAADALARNDDRPDEMLWQLAQRVRGWGRIHCVERLAHTTNPYIWDWMLREGFRNTVRIDYLAWTAATVGDLAGVLREDPDPSQLAAAGELLAALLRSGPGRAIDEYPQGEEAVCLFLEHLVCEPGTLSDFAAVAALHAFVTDDGEWATRTRESWDPTHVATLAKITTQILRRPHWPAVVDAGLASTDPIEFALADEAATALGIDTFDAHLARIPDDPLGDGWLRAWAQADTDRAERLAAAARENLPLADLAAGPPGDHGTGAAHDAYRALDRIVEALGEHPGVGADLVLAGLLSPVTRSRLVALTTLATWPRRLWPDSAIAALERIAAADPNPRNRPRAQLLLARQHDGDERAYS